MSNTIITGNTAILQNLFFGRGKATKHQLTRIGSNISAELPLTEAGKIHGASTKCPFFSVGLGTTLKSPDADLTPKNMKRIDVTSVAKSGQPYANLDDGLWDIPDAFLTALGVLNDEIESVTGITEDDLIRIGLNVEKLRGMKLTLDMINNSGMTLEQIAKIVGTSSNASQPTGNESQLVDMHGNPFSNDDFDAFGETRSRTRGRRSGTDSDD